MNASYFSFLFVCHHYFICTLYIILDTKVFSPSTQTALSTKEHLTSFPLKRKVYCVCPHQVDQVQREYMNTAGHRGQRTDDGGQDAETTGTEQKVLGRQSQNPTKTIQLRSDGRFNTRSLSLTVASSLPSVDAWPSGSQHSGTGPGCPPQWWSRSGWAHSTRTDRSPPAHICEAVTENTPTCDTCNAADVTGPRLSTWQVSMDLTICAFWQESIEPARLRMTQTADSSMKSDTCGRVHAHC